MTKPSSNTSASPSKIGPPASTPPAATPAPAPAAASHLAWAVLNYADGEEGYLRIVESILDTRDRFIDGINAIDGLRVYGTISPRLPRRAFGPDPQHLPSKHLDIFAVHDGMLDKGWNSNRIVDPEGIHLFFDYSHHDITEQYLTDLALVTAQTRAQNLTRRPTQTTYTRS